MARGDREIGSYPAAIEIRRVRRDAPGGEPVASFTLLEAFETEEQAKAAGNRAAKKWIDENPAPRPA